MDNPWASLADPPFVVAADEPHLDAFNDLLAQDDPHRIDLQLPPEPYSGMHDAPIVVLLANPGLSPADHEMWRRPGLVQRALDHLASAHGSPLYWLDDDLSDTPGGQWWRRTVGPLVGPGISFSDLAERILAVEFHGYHSASWWCPPITLPSQPFGFGLVRAALERDAVVVLARAARFWKVAIPELGHYDRVVTTRSVRNAAMSSGNLGELGFALVAKSLVG